MISRHRPAGLLGRTATICGIAAAFTLTVSVTAANDRASKAQPQLEHDGPLPRHLTEAERRYIDENPLHLLRSATDPPEGPIFCPPEYAPMAGVMMAYTGQSGWLTILNQMAARITNEGNADVYVIATTSGNANTARNNMVAAGAQNSRIKTYIAPLNSIWIRDYGPRYIYEGNVRGIVDHTYNRPRPLDNAIPLYFSGQMNHAYYEIPLVHGGGNYHLDALGSGYATRLINNENPTLTESQIIAHWQNYQNLFTHLYQPFPTSVDATQHIDMWMQVISDNKVIISDWPANPGSTQANICNAAAAHFASRGFTVYRTPARVVSGVHYNYTNVVMVNDIVLIPTYTNSTIANAGYNAQALATWQQALPNKQIFQINCQAIVGAAGVMHCIVMHVPVAPGGSNPTAYLRHPRGGQTYDPGDPVEIRWSSDDDKGVTSVNILFSTDGGATYPHVITTGTADDGSFDWNVPDLPTTDGRVRVVVHDSDGNTGFDESSGPITVTGQICDAADLNCDGVVDVLDMLMLFAAWGDCPEPSNCPADLNGDGIVDVLDMLFLFANWG